MKKRDEIHADTIDTDFKKDIVNIIKVLCLQIFCVVVLVAVKLA